MLRYVKVVAKEGADPIFNLFRDVHILELSKDLRLEFGVGYLESWCRFYGSHNLSQIMGFLLLLEGDGVFFSPAPILTPAASKS